MKNNLVKILGTFGLIIAIALVLKGVFGVGEIGVKKFSKKFSKINKLPKLECTIRVGKETKMTFDLQFYKDNKPKDIPSDTMQARKYFNKDPLNLTLVNENDNYYSLNMINNKNGMSHTITIDIKKTTGDLVLRQTAPIPLGLTVKETIDLVKKQGLDEYYGTCFKIKN
jgi:hypothetical protein